MVAVTRISSTLFIRFLYYNVQSLLGVNLNLDFCFLLDCLARSFFLFDVRGPRGGNLLQAMYPAFKFEICSAGMPCLLDLTSIEIDSRIEISAWMTFNK